MPLLSLSLVFVLFGVSLPSKREAFIAFRQFSSELMATSSPPSTGPIKSVAVVGGGVSGLAAAYKLKSNGVNVIVFESEGRAGGKLRSNSEGGFLWDEGANTMTESEKEVGNLIDALDLRDKQQFPLSQQKRYVVKNGKPEMLPFGPISFIKSSVLSTQSKIKCLMEPFMWKPFNQNNKISNEVSEESVGNFFERHFGKEIVDYCVDPFVAGTNGGDPESLYMPYAFPGLWDLEKKYGSLLIGGILSKINSKNSDKNKQNAPVKKRNTRASFSFHGGMQVLVDSLSKEIGGDNVKLNSKVLSLSYNYYDKNSPNGIWSISCDTKDSGTKNLTKKQSFDAIIMTAPLSHVQEMKFSKGKSPYIIDFLPKVNYLPLSVLVTAFKKENVKRPLEGFGVLVPSKEQEKNGLKTLGTLFSSMMFPDRAPSDQYLYTTFIGGSRNKDLGGASFDVLKEIVSSDLRKLLGAEGQPSFVKHVYWKNAFPLYGHDYNKVLEAMDKMEKNLPGLFCAGNHKDGLAVGKAIASGSKAADLVISYLNS